MQTPHADKLIRLFHRKWSVPVLAELSRTGGSRVVVLQNSLGVSPAAVRQTLDHLIEIGIATPNPGYGHPLRPEYILTDEGQAVAEACRRIQDSSARLGLDSIIGRKWTLPVLWTLAREPLRFGEITDRARPITDRALSQSLVLLQNAELISCDLLEIRPPANIYGLSRRARTITNALIDIAA
jgi:DNA-binding HxlR family transcriptional regulator